MLASNNGDPRQCAANLLKLTRGENPYDRIKGIDAAITDAPSARRDMTRSRRLSGYLTLTSRASKSKALTSRLQTHKAAIFQL